MKFLMTGLGSIGQRHVRNLQALMGPDAEIIAYRVRGRDVVIGANLEATFGEAPEAHYGIRTVESLDDGLAEHPDAVFVTNPIALHVETALAAARAGTHLFVEKPVSDRWEGVEALRAQVVEKGLVAAVGYQLRFHPGLLRVRRALRDNLIGRVCSAQLHWGEYMPGMRGWEDYRDKHEGRRREGGGAILCLNHEIDYACWLFGMPNRLYASGGRMTDMEIDVEDTASIQMEIPMDGRTVPVHLHLDFVERPSSRTCRIIGERGTIHWDYRGGTFDWYDAENDTWERESYSAFDRNTMFLDEVMDFLDSIAGAPLRCATLDEGAQALRISLAARQSLEERRVVEVGI